MVRTKMEAAAHALLLSHFFFTKKSVQKLTSCGLELSVMGLLASKTFFQSSEACFLKFGTTELHICFTHVDAILSLTKSTVFLTDIG